ncbi:NAD(P)/FAD-dependent oxidoreductase [Plantactinospora sp. KLBMP9567]|uniref:NAD(P)/FAD-dependent oxidoreductase n=1 Tax=Plantactinospora sp. KLBMP9567 TaxID=3085900 RepID=UPI0029824A4A|nr:NAD(P)/FAD-dependent oxidoreductase [Plantactinospora sp. KLBMP9567]MDW5325153.1 NAD(P)/FAD-dependent oxidoreductase [Plantactinospora sp. KLBMP9567]
MPARGYDVIVVGSRVAGAATAMLLGRRGLRVLAVDRARFPSDTLSTHQIQVPGVARLLRWGLLDQLVTTGTPATREIRLDPGGVVLAGRYPAHDGADALFSPRRTVLDLLLVDAARAAGVEVREGFDVDDLVWDQGRVVGVRGRQRGGAPVTETASLVVGADGKRSMVAAAVRATAYRERPASTFACYTYWSGVAMSGGELYQRPGRTVAVFPTNDHLTIAYLAGPAAGFPAFRADVEGHYLATLDSCGDLGARVRAGERAERFRLTPDVPNVFRVPHGPGWAPVGDAGLVMDPITGQGIGNAFRDVELLVDAIATGLDSGGRLGTELAGYRACRDTAATPMYALTLDLASFRPPSAVDRQLFAALQDRPAAVEQFLGVLSGAVPMSRFRSPRNLLNLLGPRALTRIATAELRGRLRFRQSDRGRLPRQQPHPRRGG